MAGTRVLLGRIKEMFGGNSYFVFDLEHFSRVKLKNFWRLKAVVQLPKEFLSGCSFGLDLSKSKQAAHLF